MVGIWLCRARATLDAIIPTSNREGPFDVCPLPLLSLSLSFLSLSSLSLSLISPLSLSLSYLSSLSLSLSLSLFLSLFGLSIIRVENWVLARPESRVFSLSYLKRQINSLDNLEMFGENIPSFSGMDIIHKFVDFLVVLQLIHSQDCNQLNNNQKIDKLVSASAHSTIALCGQQVLIWTREEVY